ncbi:hypothetical protein CRG98_044243 [Punica granatum]|uniref:Uncharacterized protein n=1 Tax=Punica granatum TaxID=22663 RepID=A0A2I0HVQ9_PUNGR|nr:hypothetical protein CRG98_044243 [Punica granatum]
MIELEEKRESGLRDGARSGANSEAASVGESVRSREKKSKKIQAASGARGRVVGSGFPRERVSKLTVKWASELGEVPRIELWEKMVFSPSLFSGPPLLAALGAGRRTVQPGKNSGSGQQP